MSTVTPKLTTSQLHDLRDMLRERGFKADFYYSNYTYLPPIAHATGRDRITRYLVIWDAPQFKDGVYTPLDHNFEDLDDDDYVAWGTISRLTGQ